MAITNTDFPTIDSPASRIGTKKPDFFIVGGPRCGTTAYYTYLQRHPAVFMPEFKGFVGKEPHFHCPDLNSRSHVTDLDEYLKLFEGARDDERIGEASVFYLYSEEAPARITDMTPDARVVVMLRNPVDFMHSLHAMTYYHGVETEADFRKALDLEPARAAQRELGRRQRFDETFKLLYRHLAHFTPHVERYFEHFGRDRVHVIIFDDIVKDTAGVFGDLCDFLGIDRLTDGPFEQINANPVRPKSFGWLRDVMDHPPLPVRSAARVLLPHQSWRIGISEFVRNRLLTSKKARPKLDPRLRAELTEEFRPEVRRLGDLIDRDLSAWCNVGPRS